MLERLLNNTSIVSECYIWLGLINTDGYPRAYINGDENAKVHREVFFLVNGYYPDVVRHVCDQPLCIRPDHLEPGNYLDNIQDRHDRGRTHNQVFNDEAEWAQLLRSDGLTYQAIADVLGIKRKRAEYILTKWSKGHKQFAD